MSSEVARIDKELKKEIQQLQKQIAKETGQWISEPKALNILMGRETL